MSGGRKETIRCVTLVESPVVKVEFECNDMVDFL